MRKRGSLPGRRLGAVGVVALAFAVLAAAPKKSKSPRDGDLITITTHSNVTASGAISDRNLKTEDRITHDETRSVVFRITGWTDDGDGIGMEEVSRTCDLSVSGGGHTEVKDGPKVSWTYRKVAKPGCGSQGIQFYTGGGRGSITVSAGDPQNQAEMVPRELLPGALPYAYFTAWLTVADAFTNPKWPRRLGDVGGFTFDPKERSIFRSGSETYEFRTPENPGYAGKLTVDYKISIGRAVEDQVEVELIPPTGYDKWLPQGDKDEKTIGNSIEIGIVAHRKGDPNRPPPQEVLKYTITLEGTSQEKGVDSNWPVEHLSTKDFDMRIDPSEGWIDVDGKSEGQSATTKSGMTDFRVTVNSYDWGGSTRLRVKAELKDHSVVVAHVRGNAALESVALPKDDNGNHIGDWWERWEGVTNTDANADDDSKPTGHHDGDGIALFDEYRGVHVRGRHERLSPTVKDLFVWDPDKLGTGLYGRATEVAVHVIDNGEFAFRKGAPNPYIVTPNGSHGDAWTLTLSNTSLGGLVGNTNADRIPAIPRDIRGVEIDRAAAQTAWPRDPVGYLASSIAHELGHATHLRHHGGDPPDDWAGDVSCHIKGEDKGTKGDGKDIKGEGKDTKGEDKDTKGEDKHAKGEDKQYICPTWNVDSSGFGSQEKGKPCFTVARRGGKASGGETCVMRYETMDFYLDPKGPCRWTLGNTVVMGNTYGSGVPGTTLCTSKAGTGVNTGTGPKSMGDATYGECVIQLCLNSKKH